MELEGKRITDIVTELEGSITCGGFPLLVILFTPHTVWGLASQLEDILPLSRHVFSFLPWVL